MATTIRPQSCDNFVVMPDLTADGRILLVKNSDRPAYETQPLRYEPRRTQDASQPQKLRYIEIPNVAETFAHLGSAPYWCWGYEMGINEYGLAIGNEATFSRDLADRARRSDAGEDSPRGLVGMELLRLALERAKTCQEAIDLMGGLLEQFGQFGAAGIGQTDAEGSYDNTYVMSDGKEGWVLETAGPRWCAQRIDKGFWSVSNEISLRDGWTRASSDLTEHARALGWPGAEGDKVDFAQAYTDPAVPRQVSHIRVQRTKDLLGQATKVDFAYARKVMSDHYENTFLDGPYFNAAAPDFLSVCMHYSPGEFTWGNTAASSITPMKRDDSDPIMMWWAPVTPCTSIYLPVYVAAGEVPTLLSDAGKADTTGQSPDPATAADFGEGSLWWWFQALLDWAKGDADGMKFTARQQQIRSVLDPLQDAWYAEAEQVRAAAVSEPDSAAATYAAFTQRCAEQARDAARGLIEG